MIRYVGLDVHKDFVEVYFLDRRGTRLEGQRVACTRSALTEFAKTCLKRQDRVALESGTRMWSVVALLLEPYAGEIVVGNPLKTKSIAEAKIKTDKVDAEVLAQLLRCNFLPTVWQPDAQTRELRRLTSQRAVFVAERTRIRNRIRSVLSHLPIELPSGNLWRVPGIAWLEKVPLPEHERVILNCDLAAAFLGLAPSTRQSGNHCYHGPITKAGRGHTRWLLVQAAQRLDRNPGPLGVFFRRLLRKKNRNVAVVSAARKLVTIAFKMLQRNEPYRHASPGSTNAKLSRIRCRVTHTRRSFPNGAAAKTRVPGLSEVYQKEDLPLLTLVDQLPPGERRVLRCNRLPGVVRQIQTGKACAKPVGKAKTSKVT